MVQGGDCREWLSTRRPEILAIYRERVRQGRLSAIQWYETLSVREDALMARHSEVKSGFIWDLEGKTHSFDMLLYIPRRRRRASSACVHRIEFRGNHATTDERDVR